MGGVDSRRGEPRAGHLQPESRESPQDMRGAPLMLNEERSLPSENRRSTNLSSWEAVWFGEERFWIQGIPLLLNACVIVGKLLFP